MSAKLIIFDCEGTLVDSEPLGNPALAQVLDLPHDSKLGPNACSSGAYDLTSNETGVCSECGATAETSSDSA